MLFSNFENISNTKANDNAVKNCPGYGNFGLQMSANELAPCSANQYTQAMAQESRDARLVTNANNQFYGNNYKSCAGFGSC